MYRHKHNFIYSLWFRPKAQLKAVICDTFLSNVLKSSITHKIHQALNEKNTPYVRNMSVKINKLRGLSNKYHISQEMLSFRRKNTHQFYV